MGRIAKEILIEDLVREFPASVGYMMDRGIKCIACGEPVWGTLESVARKKGFSEQDIDNFVGELNAMSKSNFS
jgi:hypothetical protein